MAQVLYQLGINNGYWLLLSRAIWLFGSGVCFFEDGKLPLVMFMSKHWRDPSSLTVLHYVKCNQYSVKGFWKTFQVLQFLPVMKFHKICGRWRAQTGSRRGTQGRICREQCGESSRQRLQGLRFQPSWSCSPHSETVAVHQKWCEILQMREQWSHVLKWQDHRLFHV